jgi:hypothetical protein
MSVVASAGGEGRGGEGGAREEEASARRATGRVLPNSATHRVVSFRLKITLTLMQIAASNFNLPQKAPSWTIHVIFNWVFHLLHTKSPIKSSKSHASRHHCSVPLHRIPLPRHSSTDSPRALVPQPSCQTRIHHCRSLSFEH